MGLLYNNFYIGNAFQNEKIEENAISWQHLSGGKFHKHLGLPPALRNWKSWPGSLVPTTSWSWATPLPSAQPALSDPTLSPGLMTHETHLTPFPAAPDAPPEPEPLAHARRNYKAYIRGAIGSLTRRYKTETVPARAKVK